MPTVQSMLSQLTLEEKAALCTGASAWTTVPVERLGLPEMVLSDGPHGVRRVPDNHAMAARHPPLGHARTGRNHGRSARLFHGWCTIGRTPLTRT